MRISKSLSVKKGHKRVPLSEYLSLSRKVKDTTLDDNLKCANAIAYFNDWEEHLEESDLEYFKERGLKDYLRFMGSVDILVKVGKRRIEVRGIPFYDKEERVVYLIKENYLLGERMLISKASLKALKELLLNNANNSQPIEHVKII